MKSSKKNFAKRISVDYSASLSGAIGAGGLSEGDLSKISASVKTAVKKLNARRASGEVGFAELPDDFKNASDIKKYADKLKGKCRNFAVLGIGGSALGPRALIDALAPSFYNMRDLAGRGGRPRIIIADNISPEFVKGIFDIAPVSDTVFNVITKSGTTGETLSIFSAALAMLKKKTGKSWKKHIVITTDPEKGYLREFARKNGIDSFSIPSNVGGRFSTLSSVGLLPAAAAGIDIKKLLKGAGDAGKFCFKEGLKDNPAALYAAMHYLFYKRGRRINVFMPYSENLATVSEWFAQLWAESLGKKKDRNGRDVFVGPTPVKAKGVTDQHSQLQLYTEGPQDKVVTLLSVEGIGSFKIPKLGDFVFGGRDISELFKAEEAGTALSLGEARRPVITIKMPEVTPEYVGQLLMMLMAATAIYGEMLNINTFDQPGVEYGKIIAKKILSAKGRGNKRQSNHKGNNVDCLSQTPEKRRRAPRFADKYRV
ncbi:glucose-6-phosphate isomerase [bacterium]|nr:glucose-6-phosphate isomerase [bacterium]MBU3955379.1 glucose-6-phosphate isomerase [bacterium]MBU4133859.1 glucose-6-phosphate isomerase [bacterium]